MKLLDNPTTFTIEGARRALQFRGIDSPEHYNTMLTITLALFAVVTLVIFIPLARRSIIAASIWFIGCCVSVIPVMNGYNDLQMEMVSYAPVKSMMELFHICDGIVIMIGYCYGISYEAANLIIFAVVQPAIIVALFIFSLTCRKRSPRQALT